MATGPADRTANDLPADLEEALRVGPFHIALRAAIKSSGLGLDVIERRLATRGLHIGRSTLSYWQQGRRRPERDASLAALSVIEELLSVPPDSLTGLLGPKKPRGRWVNHRIGVLGWADMWAANEDVLRLVNIDNRRNSDRVQDISLTENFQIGPDRRMQWLEIYTVTQARETGADRSLLVYNSDPDVDVSRITLSDMEDCRIGRHRAEVQSNLVAFELLFDRRLSVGETYVYSYRVNFGDAFLTAEELSKQKLNPFDATQGVRAFRRTSNAYVMKARFDPDALPVRCFRVHSTRMSGTQQVVDDIGLSAQGSAHIAIQDVTPGVHGIRWEWA